MDGIMTLLFAPLFLDGPERFERNIQWIKQVVFLKQYLTFDKLLMIDNGSNPELLQKFKDFLIQTINFKYEIEEHKVRLLRTTEHGYSFWYYAFGRASDYAIKNNYNKIVHFDSDVWLLNKNICNFINNLNNGWNCFWSEMHQYPESTFQVIGSDRFENMHEFMTRDFLRFYPNGLAEKEIPWTNIIKEFKGDRYGEKNLEQQSWMDYYGQKPNHIKLNFNEN